MTWKFKLMFEWGGGALWPDDDATRDRFDIPADEQLPLSPELRDRLDKLSAWHDTALNWDYPPDPSPWPEEEFAKFEAAAMDVLEDVRRELGPEYEVRYKPL